ncbi:MAG TPA: nucleoside hydrolase [Acidobacteriaceae bacterium]|jgi:inosine-uridine nucleoside N-ribohydrolase|nr:nucleoside hydrolase [Acidobacteriaceae bacterium]
MRQWKFPLLPLLALLACSVCLHAAPAPKSVPVLLDTDIGTDIDDAFAVALILQSPELNLRAVTTVSGDTAARARLVAKMLWVDGRHNIPVAAGSPGSKLDIAQTRWADGFTSPTLRKEPAVALMKSTIDREHGKLVLIAIGPLTNVAALLRQYPGEKKKIREIVLMGGSIARGYAAGSGPVPEYNIAADAPAAQVVFTSGIPILMAPLDVTARLQLDEAHRQRIFAKGTPLTDALQAVYKLWGQPTPTLYDPMAVALYLDPQLCTTQRLAIQVDDHGMTLVEQGKPANTVVGVETDPARFFAFYMSRVAP